MYLSRQPSTRPKTTERMVSMRRRLSASQPQTAEAPVRSGGVRRTVVGTVIECWPPPPPPPPPPPEEAGAPRSIGVLASMFTLSSSIQCSSVPVLSITLSRSAATSELRHELFKVAYELAPERKKLLYSRARKVRKVVAKGLGYSVEKLADV
ncbi:hypothetical protein TYRP_005866 [Tyrophagus putrescentiae]|nr:hypothetical protein TYRP_005866 [Tyrophagus putrescentiae]